MRRQATKPSQGFTIIEISLAMAFLATLLITIAMLTTHIIGIYQKGMSIKSVNSTGRALIDDLSRSIAVAPANDVAHLCNEKLADAAAREKCHRDGAYKFMFQQFYTNDLSPTNSSDKKRLPIHGVFCSGQYSYIWNTGYAHQSAMKGREGYERHMAKLKYRLSMDSHYSYTQSASSFKLLKVPDGSRQLCSAHVTPDYGIANSNIYDLSKNANLLTLTEEPAELLNDRDRKGLVLYDFRIFPSTQHKISRHSFYSGSFILATLAGGVDISGIGNYCQDPPDKLNTDFAYCAINKFNFAMRATGESTDEDR